MCVSFIFSNISNIRGELKCASPELFSNGNVLAVRKESEFIQMILMNSNKEMASLERRSPACCLMGNITPLFSTTVHHTMLASDSRSSRTLHIVQCSLSSHIHRTAVRLSSAHSLPGLTLNSA